MISSDLAEVLFTYIMIDPGSPYSDTGFEISLHHAGDSGDLTDELAEPSYARAFIAAGPGSWAVGQRSVISLVDIVFPATSADEYWRGVRSHGLWSADTSQLLFGGIFDDPGLYVGDGDQLVIPAGGLVYRFG